MDHFQAVSTKQQCLNKLRNEQIKKMSCLHKKMFKTTSTNECKQKEKREKEKEM